MSIFDKHKGDDTDNLPNMETEQPTLADAAKQARYATNDFRARENIAATEDNNEGLPSVNRRSGNNKLITMLGFIFILGSTNTNQFRYRGYHGCDPPGYGSRWRHVNGICRGERPRPGGK
jgi:hypothetical protein